jgi:hypothetical protein
MALFGKDAKLYYSSSPFTGSNTADDLTWTEMTYVSDHTDNFSPVEDDVTTREIAAAGVAASAIVLNEVEISFSYIMEASDTVFSALWTAFNTRAAFTCMTLSGAKTSTSSIGFAANFSVSLNWQKNIRNKQVANFTLKVLRYPNFVTGSASL